MSQIQLDGIELDPKYATAAAAALAAAAGSESASTIRELMRPVVKKPGRTYFVASITRYHEVLGIFSTPGNDTDGHEAFEKICDYAMPVRFYRSLCKLRILNKFSRSNIKSRLQTAKSTVPVYDMIAGAIHYEGKSFNGEYYVLHTGS